MKRKIYKPERSGSLNFIHTFSINSSVYASHHIKWHLGLNRVFLDTKGAKDVPIQGSSRTTSLHRNSEKKCKLRKFRSLAKKNMEVEDGWSSSHSHNEDNEVRIHMFFV
jgi:hypothetical protein